MRAREEEECGLVWEGVEEREREVWREARPGGEGVMELEVAGGVTLRGERRLERRERGLVRPCGGRGMLLCRERVERAEGSARLIRCGGVQGWWCVMSFIFLK